MVFGHVCILFLLLENLSILPFISLILVDTMGVNMKCENWHSDPPGGLKRPPCYKDHFWPAQTLFLIIISYV